MKSIANSMVNIKKIFSTTLSEKLKLIPESQHVWVAYSGGVDSHVLLHLLTNEIPKERLKALHINHGISELSDKWQQHCEKITRDLGIDLTVKKINTLHNTDTNLESRAREARLALFCSTLNKDEVIFLAHHAMDQVETMLMRLFKGAGPQGLCGIKEIQQYKSITLLRPLLDIKKHEIQKYAKEQNLEWIEDDSNSNIKFERNYLRHEIIPLLNKTWPSLTNNLLRCQLHHLEQEQYLESIIKPINDEVLKENKLDLKALLLQNNFLQKYILREWLKVKLSYPPSTKQLITIQDNIINAKSGAKPELLISNKKIRRYKNFLYITSNENLTYPAGQEIIWQAHENSIYLELLKIKLIKNSSKSNILKHELIIKFRQNGERFQPQGRQGSHPLKKLMQEWQIPPWKRDKTPLIYLKENLIAVPGYALGEKYFMENDNINIIKVVESY
ncbi:MAG: tRNA lysidine(34) synthetase TilS [Pseudomonadota bacterium]|nr:tRNA lysidine(34) synthetase TilS [Pseudomonadota bacterium]